VPGCFYLLGRRARTSLIPLVVEKAQVEFDRMNGCLPATHDEDKYREIMRQPTP